MDVRYREAMDKASNKGCAPVLQQLVTEITRHSRAVLCRHYHELANLVHGQGLASFHTLVQAGVRFPQDNKWDDKRHGVDGFFFPEYANEIRFAALSLDDRGLGHYGSCCIFFRDQTIAHRTSVFHENTILFARNFKVYLFGPSPSGYRATWDDRGLLSGSKLVDDLSPTTTRDGFANLLLQPGVKIGDDDQFVEVHIYGSLTIDSAEQVVIRLSPTENEETLRVENIKAKLQAVNVQVSCPTPSGQGPDA